MNNPDGLIYKIICKDEDKEEFYIGSTYNINCRMHEHTSHCNNKNSIAYTQKKYVYFRKNGGIENFKFIIIGKFPNISRKDLKYKEREFFERFNPTLNMFFPIRTKEETIKLGRINKRKYKEKNYDMLNEKYNCFCGGNFTYTNKFAHTKSLKHQKYISNKVDDYVEIILKK